MWEIWRSSFSTAAVGPQAPHGEVSALGSPWVAAKWAGMWSCILLGGCKALQDNFRVSTEGVCLCVCACRQG